MFHLILVNYCGRKKYNMLEDLLTYKDCANCKICCKFEPDELIDAPTFTKEEKEYVLNNINSNIDFVKKGKVYQIILNKYNNKYICPLLKDNRYIITITYDCPILKNISDEKIINYIKVKFLPIVYNIIKENPDMVTEYNRNMKIIYELPKID